jgi:hypothetical protein
MSLAEVFKMPESEFDKLIAKNNEVENDREGNQNADNRQCGDDGKVDSPGERRRD